MPDVAALSAHQAPAWFRQARVPLPPLHQPPVGPNIPTRRYWLPSENRYVRLRLSVKWIKTVDKLGVEVAVARLRARGERF